MFDTRAQERAAPPRPLCPGCDRPLAGEPILRGPDRLVGAPGEFTVRLCPACGLASTQPQLRPDQFAVYYPESYSAYAKPPSRRRSQVDRARIELMLRFGPYRRLYRRPPGRLLDVGCGTGTLAEAFARHGWSAAGVEPSNAACAHAAARGIDVHCGTLDDAPFSEASFDAIVFNHSLEHIPDPARALRRAAQLLRAGGMLAVGVPNFASWQRRLFGAHWFQLDLPRHLQHFDAASLNAMLERAGLEPVGVCTQSMRPSLLKSLQYRLFGRVVSRGRGMSLAVWASAPISLAADALFEGDCLHAFALRPRT